MTTNNKILLVDDEKDILELFEMLFESEGFDVTTANSGNEAIEILHNNHFDVIFSDFKMPNGNGQSLLEWVKYNYKDDTLFYFCSGQTDKSEKELKAMGALRLFEKPIDIVKTIQTIKKDRGVV